MQERRLTYREYAERRADINTLFELAKTDNRKDFLERLSVLMREGWGTISDECDYRAAVRHLIEEIKNRER